jgi:hypothetical protein
MGAPNTIYVQQYNTAIYLLAQQLDNRFAGAIVEDFNWTGAAKFYPQYATDSMVELTTRFADTPTQPANFANRMVTPRYFVSSTLEDPKDALQQAVDPKSAMMQAKHAAANRTKDDLIIAAWGGTSYTGQTGATAVTFPSANQIVYNQFTTGNGMSKAKCLAAKRILDAGEVEATERFAAYTAAQLEDLLNTTEVTSSDYNVIHALVQGEVRTWCGFQWLHSERLLTDASSHRLNYFWQKNASILAIQKDIEGRVDERIDKNMAWQVYLKMCMGSTRLEEARIVQVACVENAF